MITLRSATTADARAIWNILEPMIRAGETYPLSRDMSRQDALTYWFEDGHEVFVAQDGDEIVGTYFLRPNQSGGGSHVANCGYVTAAAASGRGIGRMMCEHSLRQAHAKGFQAMQFNFVISSNERAVSLWQRLGFKIVGTLPKAFQHPTRGFVDALVMYRSLDNGG